MTVFIKKAIKNGSSLIVTLPKEMVDLFEVKNGDILELDLIKNHRDKK